MPKDAVLGRVHFLETGDAVYLTTAGDLLGRGIGSWICEGHAVAFQLDIFQYEARVVPRGSLQRRCWVKSGEKAMMIIAVGRENIFVLNHYTLMNL